MASQTLKTGLKCFKCTCYVLLFLNNNFTQYHDHDTTSPIKYFSGPTEAMVKQFGPRSLELNGPSLYVQLNHFINQNDQVLSL